METHKQPHNAFTVKDVQHVKSFITSYTEENAISLPGRIPGYKDYKISLLPSDKSKHAIHHIYITYTRLLLLPPTLEVLHIAYFVLCGTSMFHISW